MWRQTQRILVHRGSLVPDRVLSTSPLTRLPRGVTSSLDTAKSDKYAAKTPQNSPRSSTHPAASEWQRFVEEREGLHSSVLGGELKSLENQHVADFGMVRFDAANPVSVQGQQDFVDRGEQRERDLKVRHEDLQRN